MKKLIIIFTLVLVGFAAIVAVLKIVWLVREKKPLNIYILDKSVTKIDRPEHKSFVWILNNKRFVLPNNKSYSNTSDYFGFFPIDFEKDAFDLKSIRINDVDNFAQNYDVAYYTDCYGVHSYEWYKGKASQSRTQKVYGGLNHNDYLLLRKMLDNGKLIICEYNMFSSPTNALVRTKAEELFGISWSGWSGKYYSSLDIESNEGPQEWMKNLFESQHMGVWPNDKSGIVLLHNDGLIELLLDEKDLICPIPKILSTDSAIERFGVAKSVDYNQWFEIIKPGSNTIHANFTLDVTTEGKAILEKIGLSFIFPAVIESPSNEKYFYFCGDFAENPSFLLTAKIGGGATINSLLNSITNPSGARFFQSFYSPLIHNILNDYYNKKNN